MTVTQAQIDYALGLTDGIIASLGNEAAIDLVAGCEPCKEIFTEYNELQLYIFMLNQGLAAVDSGCLTMMDLWVATQKITSMVSC